MKIIYAVHGFVPKPGVNEQQQYMLLVVDEGRKTKDYLDIKRDWTLSECATSACGLVMKEPKDQQVEIQFGGERIIQHPDYHPWDIEVNPLNKEERRKFKGFYRAAKRAALRTQTASA